jgi:hypothetical protein
MKELLPQAQRVEEAEGHRDNSRILRRSLLNLGGPCG